MFVWIWLFLPYLTASLKLLIAYFNNAEVVNFKNWSRESSRIVFMFAKMIIFYKFSPVCKTSFLGARGTSGEEGLMRISIKNLLNI